MFTTIIRKAPSMLALACALWAQGAQAQTDTIRIGQLKIISPALPAIEQGHFRDHGIDAEVVFFRSGAELLPALATGQIDMAYTSPGAGLFNAFGSGVDVKLVGDWISYPKGSTTNAIMVGADHPEIKTLADLKGRTVAVTSIGQLTHYATGRALQSVGLSLKDVDLVKMSYPDTVVGLSNGVVVAGNETEPYVTDLTAQNSAHVLAAYGDIAPGLQGGVLAFGTRLLSEDRELGKRAMAALHEGGADMIAAAKDPGKRPAMAAIFNKFIPLNDPNVYLEISWPLPSDDQKINVASIRDQLDFVTEQGLLNKEIDLNALIDQDWN